MRFMHQIKWIKHKHIKKYIQIKGWNQKSGDIADLGVNQWWTVLSRISLDGLCVELIIIYIIKMNKNRHPKIIIEILFHSLNCSNLYKNWNFLLEWFYLSEHVNTEEFVCRWWHCMGKTEFLQVSKTCRLVASTNLSIQVR